jgi:hypothetical protein
VNSSAGSVQHPYRSILSALGVDREDIFDSALPPRGFFKGPRFDNRACWQARHRLYQQIEASHVPYT